MGWTLAEIERDMRRRYMEAREANPGEIDPEWIVQGAMADNATDVHGDDADYALCAASGFLRQAANRCLRRQKPKATEPEQIEFDAEGFKHLQPDYDIERLGRRVWVPREAATDEELLAKAEELRAMGRGCFEHADEIVRYVATRQSDV